MAEIKVLSANELAPNEIKQVFVDDREPIAVYNLAGEYFATDDTCTHGQASLSEGSIEGDEIFCPFHMGAFSMKTGEATAPPCVAPLRIYPVRVEGDSVYLELED